MRITFLAASVFTTAIFAATAFAAPFEVKVRVVRYGQASQPVKDCEISAVPWGRTPLDGLRPGRTNGSGNASIKFDSPGPTAEIHFQVTDAPDDENWYVKFHGVYPEGRDENPYVARPADAPVLVLEAFKKSEFGGIFRESLNKGQTGIFAGAIAAAVTLPSEKAPSSKLPDPLKAPEAVAASWGLSQDDAKRMIKQWQTLVDADTSAAKPDQKSLSAILKGDLKAAADFAKRANSLPADAKSRLIAMPDTGRLVQTVSLFSTAARSPSGTEDRAVEQKLLNIERDLKPFIPALPPHSPQNRARLENFSQLIRERTASS